MVSEIVEKTDLIISRARCDASFFERLVVDTQSVASEYGIQVPDIHLVRNNMSDLLEESCGVTCGVSCKVTICDRSTLK